jgi:hypothetical protein
MVANPLVLLRPVSNSVGVLSAAPPKRLLGVYPSILCKGGIPQPPKLLLGTNNLHPIVILIEAKNLLSSRISKCPLDPYPRKKAARKRPFSALGTRHSVLGTNYPFTIVKFPDPVQPDPVPASTHVPDTVPLFTVPFSTRSLLPFDPDLLD